MQCYNCFKFGHKRLECRGIAKCATCSCNKHESECTVTVPKCVNCPEGRNSHKSTDKRCEMYRRHAEVQVLMAYEDLSYREARNKVFGDSYSHQRTTDNFPKLKKKALNRARGININKKSFAMAAASPATLTNLNTESNTKQDKQKKMSSTNIPILNTVNKSQEKIADNKKGNLPLETKNMKNRNVNMNFTLPQNTPFPTPTRKPSLYCNQKEKLQYTNLNELRKFNSSINQMDTYDEESTLQGAQSLLRLSQSNEALNTDLLDFDLHFKEQEY
ncbi:hypothetical protein TKK_0016389 [Trichogramma kaykai]